MKKSVTQKNSPAPHQRLSFQSKLERIASDMDYFAFSVPKKITLALGTLGPIPVFAQAGDSEKFLASLFPVGGGRHYLRIRNQICKAAGIKEGQRVHVQVTVRDRSAEVSIPKDLMRALRAEGVADDFKALPVGKRSFLLRCIDAAAKPETRDKRIQSAVEEAHRKRERRVDRRAGVGSSGKTRKR